MKCWFAIANFMYNVQKFVRMFIVLSLIWLSRRSVGAFRRTYMLQLRDYGFEPRTHRQQVFRQKYIHRIYSHCDILYIIISTRTSPIHLVRFTWERIIVQTVNVRSPLLETLLVSKIAISYQRVCTLKFVRQDGVHYSEYIVNAHNNSIYSRYQTRPDIYARLRKAKQ